MYKINVPIAGTEQTVIRNILIEVTNDIIRLLGFNHDIYFTLDDKNGIPTFLDKLGNTVPVSSPLPEYITIEHEESSQDMSDLSLTYNNPDYHPIYQDKDIGSIIRPIYIKRKSSLTVRYVAKSRSKLTELANKIRTLPARGGMYIIHNLNYYYNLPNAVTSILDNINRLKNNRTTSSMDIGEYINSTFDINKLDIAGAPDGDAYKNNIVIRDMQHGVYGYILDEIGDIKKEQDSDQNGWAIEFTYELNYEVPIELSFTYPLVVYNQTLDKEFTTFIEVNDPIYKGRFTEGTQDIMDIVTVTTKELLSIPRGSYYLAIPEQDKFILPKPIPYMARALSALSIVDDNQPKVLFNITDIEGLTFNSDILTLLRESEYKYATTPYSSIIYFELYKDGNIDDLNKLYLDSDLNFTTENDLDNKSIYRVAMNILVDLNLLKRKDLRRINNYIADNDIGDNVIDSYANVFNVPKETLPKGINDIKVVTPMQNHSWDQYYVRQTVINITAICNKDIDTTA